MVKLFARYHSYGTAIRSSSSSSRESGDICQLARRLSKMLNIFTRKSSTQATKSLSPSNTKAQLNTDADKSVARDGLKSNTDTSQQGTEHAPKDGQEVPGQGAESPPRGPPGVPKGSVKKPRVTDLATLSALKDDFLKCKYCGQTSRNSDFIDRVQTLRKPAARGVTPTRTLTPVRCKLCYSPFPVSPQAQPRIPSTVEQEKELAAKGKLKILLPTPKLSTLRRTYNIMMEERRLLEEKDEDKKRERGTSHYVDRDALLLKMHVRRHEIARRDSRSRGHQGYLQGRRMAGSRATLSETESLSTA